MAAPRLRQLRRDNTLFKLAMNAVRLHLEEDDRLARQPQLRTAPDTDLEFVQHSIDQWVGVATKYIAHKFRCPAPQAMQLLGELLVDLKTNIPVGELRQVPYQQALFLPPAWVTGQQPIASAPAAEEG
ncbi:hypothetical protein GKZ68_19705 [Hymenobacter sp. BRD128]|uniref:hypothetical protein n=1 Tax=Hymenobacter sp. BRD128 TaxID=2675878 RepID=UPI0015648A3A|nr:hypothetical protein [Hymenobacter sp. BRD128]QKG58659.1 hypothetical protein GKZ68_19705 [Hymenobacter sp. BRD128]